METRFVKNIGFDNEFMKQNICSLLKIILNDSMNGMNCPKQLGLGEQLMGFSMSSLWQWNHGKEKYLGIILQRTNVLHLLLSLYSQNGILLTELRKN